ncbi:MAG: hypothetical protein AAGF12_11160 [Myxococcota bacterium]
MTDRQPKHVFTIIERSNGSKHWLRIGTAFVNRDGSLNVVLDAFPSNGKLQIRERSFRDADGRPDGRASFQKAAALPARGPAHRSTKETSSDAA